MKTPWKPDTSLTTIKPVTRFYLHYCCHQKYHRHCYRDGQSSMKQAHQLVGQDHRPILVVDFCNLSAQFRLTIADVRIKSGKNCESHWLWKFLLPDSLTACIICWLQNPISSSCWRMFADTIGWSSDVSIEIVLTPSLTNSIDLAQKTPTSFSS